MTLPPPDRILATLRALRIVGPSGDVEVEIGRAGAVVHDHELTWVVTELPTSARERAGVTMLTIDLDHDGRGPGIGVALAAQEGCWRLDDQDDVKDLLGTLVRAGAADAMATALATFQSGGRPERAVLDGPELLDAIGAPVATRRDVHAPRLTAGSSAQDWRLEFWSVGTAHLQSNRYTLNRWIATGSRDEVAWWAAPAWSTL